MLALTPLDCWSAQKIGLGPIRLNREALAAYQLQRFQETLRLVTASSGFYRDRLGLTAVRSVGSLSDIAALPFTTAADLRQSGQQMLCVSQSSISRVVTLNTSGTSGEPKRIWFTEDDQDRTIDFFRAGMSTLVAPGDRVLVLLPCERPGSVGELLARALTSAGIVAISHGPVRSLAETLQAIRSNKVNSLVGIPVQVLALARYSVQEGLRPIKMKSILLSTDHAADSLIRAVERIWQCQVFDHYGMTEMGLGGGVECTAHNGYHLREADLYFEIIDPDSGQMLPAGCEGEVVFSTLTRMGMPLIRYRTGDFSRFLPEQCACGSVLKRLDRIGSRREAAIQLPDGTVLPLSLLDEAIFSIPGVIDFSVLVEETQQLMTVHVSLLTVGDKNNSVFAVRERIGSIGGVAASRLKIKVQATMCKGSLPPLSGKRIVGIVTGGQ